jgi:hypothetical protein
VGPGSISFEMIRFMTELFPIVPGPPWMKNLSQPIAARNVIDYLLAALDNVTGQGGVFEVGGPQVMRYSELMLEYARLRGLKRRMITFPYIPLWFMSIGVGLTSPVPAPIAHALIDGLRSDSRIQDHAVLRVFGDVKLISYEEAVTSSLADLNPQKLEPVWTDMGRPAVSMRHEGFFISHRLHVEAAPGSSLSGLGGDDCYARRQEAAWLQFFLRRSTIPLEPARMGWDRDDRLGRRLLLRSDESSGGGLDGVAAGTGIRRDEAHAERLLCAARPAGIPLLVRAVPLP